MFLRRIGAGTPFGRNKPESSDDAERLTPSVRVLPRTPMYPGGAYGGDSRDLGEEVETVARKLIKKMSDRKFHSDVDLARGSTPVEVLAALGELVSDGYAFDRSGRSLRLRARGISELPQDLMLLVSGLYPRQEVVPICTTQEESSDSADVARTVEAPTVEVSLSGGLVLSDPPDYLTIPIEHIGSLASVILAKRGVGKTYLGHVIVEELLAMDPPLTVVVFDPTGVWWGLCSAADGSPSSSGLLLLGGSRGHMGVSHRDGGRLAELAGDRASTSGPVRVVVDLSEMAPAEQHELVADFCERLFTLPHFPVHLVFDEADEFCPQKLGVSGHQRRSLGHVERLVMRGRARGIGATLISLRPAVVSKNVVSQVDALYLMRMVEPNDLRAVRGRLEKFESGITPEQREQCLGLLPVLPVGTSYFLRGGDPVMFRRFRVRAKRTYDSSRTPVLGEVVSSVLGKPRPDLLSAARRVFGLKDVK